MNARPEIIERTVSFPYGSEPAYGILHLPPPDVAARKVGLLFINSGLRTRCGPHRLYTQFARRLSAAGYHVLRYDPPGIGEGLGTLVDSNDYRHRLFESLETNTDALNFFQAETRVEEIGLFGLCGGAYRAMLAGASDSRVRFLILAGLPVPYLGDLSQDAVTGITLRSYLFKAKQIRTWYRLFTGDINLGWVLRALGRAAKKSESEPVPTLDPDLMEASVEYCKSGRRVLFAYGDADWLYEPFSNEYWDKVVTAAKNEQALHLHAVKRADHVFSQIHWQNELFDNALAWLKDAENPQV